MTIPNSITLFRFFLIPVFVGALLYYDESGAEGSPDEMYRWVAVIAFIIASLSDALDGYIARAYKMTSQFGTVMDPLADKLLILSAIFTLSYIRVEGLESLPIWFPVLVVTRDAVLVVGTAVLHVTTRSIKVRPHWTGKVATAFQMVLICVILLKFHWIPFAPLVWMTGGFILASMVVYFSRGINLAHRSGMGESVHKGP